MMISGKYLYSFPAEGPDGPSRTAELLLNLGGSFTGDSGGSGTYYISGSELHFTYKMNMELQDTVRQKVFSIYNNSDQIKEMLIESPLNTKLNKLKKTNAEASFYWFQIYELEKQISPTS